MKNNTKTVWKIIAAVGALMMIGFIFIIYNAFCGNFISGMYFKWKVDKYIAETYPDKHYEVSDYNYSFKTGDYIFNIIDPDSEDGCFTAYYSGYEKAVIDSYENDVLHLDNTLIRLDLAFSNELDPLIDRYLDTKEKTVNGQYIGGEFGYATIITDNYDENDLKEKLYLDMPVNAKNMPLPTEISLCLNSDESESFKRVRKMASEFKTLGYRIDYYDFSTSGKPYETVPAEKLLDAESLDDLEKYVMKDYDKELCENYSVILR